MDPARENSTERGGRTVSVRNVLLGSGAGGVNIWGGDLGFVAEMYRKMEGVHMGFLRQVTGQMSKRQRDGTWRHRTAVSVIKEAGTHTPGTYIDKRQATVVEWVALRPILEVCDRKAGYEEGGRCREPW